ncbi:Ribonuclease BN [Nitrospira tepida]|uniref:Ribonuclease BN n=1 Tax=Nitrospira tepida TaxID=2973512 RepID=A0AA86MYL6_9BACT|nr:Ribonuclease BN [Nitrospira tepida]
MTKGWDWVSPLTRLGRTGILAWRMAREVMLKFSRDHGLFLASGLAFSLLLYAIPLALIMISALGYTVLESQQAMQEVQSVIRQFLPKSEQIFAENVEAVVADRGLLGAVGFTLFVALSTTLFGFVRHVLNVVFQAGPGRSLLRGTAHDLLMLAFCVALLIAAIGLASLFAVIGNIGAHVPAVGFLWGKGIRMIHRITGILLGTGLILGLYRFSPVKTLKLGSLAVGAAVAVSLFGLAKQAFAWYVQFAQANIALYGALGAFLFFFLWLYYVSVLFVVGAEAAWVFEHRRTLVPSAGGAAQDAIEPFIHRP